jgi:hypothetical protein
MNIKAIAFLTGIFSLLAFPPAPLYAAPPGQNQASEQQFASVIDDLPLMPGLKTTEDKDVLFVEPHQGRIAETEASGEVPIDGVYDFYRHSLPHLGWKVIDGRTFEREGERLQIDARASGNVTTVRFTVKPAAAN